MDILELFTMTDEKQISIIFDYIDGIANSYDDKESISFRRKIESDSSLLGKYARELGIKGNFSEYAGDNY